MKTAAGFGLVLLLATGAFGQFRGGRGGGPIGRSVTPVNGGYGNVVFPATGAPPVSRFGTGFGNAVFPGFGFSPTVLSITNPRFAGNLGATVSGIRPRGGFGGFGHQGRGNGAGYVYVPFAYPVYTGGYYPDYSGQQQPNVTVVYPQQAPPITIINQVPAPAPAEAASAETAPAESSYYEAPTPAPAPPPPAASSTSESDNYYLIAMKDHTVYAAVAYWIDGDTLHYFTKGNVHNQASLSLVDKDLTERLNRERDITVKLPR